MNAALMRLERHERGIHAVCADTATFESLYRQSLQNVKTQEHHRPHLGASLMIN
jgi:hypothetical protein